MGSVVEGSAVFKLLLVKYDNRNEKDWGGSCCDQWCAGGCDHKFTFCFDEYNGNDNFRSCEHGRWTSREINNANVNTFRNSIGGVPNPITKYFTSWPGGLKFKTEVYDDDDFNSSDLVDRLFKLINLTPAKGAATSTWHTTDIVGTRSRKKTTLSIKYMAYCDKNYFGAKCDVHCKAMDSAEGHFRCDPDTGAKVCLSGWEDPKKSCTILKDNCAAVQCLNGGTCIDLYNSYICTCPSGFEGDHCELNLDDCASQPCQNGATCVDGEDSYICQCSPGYVGINCESHVCATPSDVCLNGGTCYGTGQCFCPPGFVGSTCDIHRCNVTVCLNGGTCNDDGTCTCPPAYLGALCGVNMNAWLEHACGTLVHCDNGGTCHIGKCYCSEDYTGKYCSSRIDDCVGNPCLNEGVCEDGVSSYTCRCQADYNGTHCEEELGPPVWEEQILKNVTDEVFDVPTMKEVTIMCVCWVGG
ncbi:hypothetical protein CAPTEDRAFT_181870 [Capitella teleta]|uniref:Delta-like protein n=1 Tax=Capitella teleta TaxID=283909 RepID=R7UWS1_CAPTE|nr:hypothetical protein CAPTEDRAFT_181870 [Capitella teleta]|eukprot:ELU08382.1 hypothetical protein CAPTEDRAFT_181870 [Capitella teleta]